MDKIKVLLADDQTLFSESLKHVLQSASDNRIEVCGIAENGKEAVDFLEDCRRENRPDVILMDIRMPIMDGVETTEVISRQYPDIKILILTTFNDDELAYDALTNGARGFILKKIDPQELILSIQSVHKGAIFISPSVGFKLIEMMNPVFRPQTREDIKTDIVLKLLEKLPQLSRREAEIVYYVSRAESNKDIGSELNIAEKTVKNHLNSIYSKLQVHSRLLLINHINKILL